MHRANLSKDTIAACMALLLCTACSTTVGARPGASVGDIPSKGPVGRTIKDHADRFSACGRDAVSIQTGTTQHMQLKFIVDAEGNVLKPQIVQMDEPDPDLYTCVLRTLKRLQFPKPSDGKEKTVQYPLVLKPE